MLDKFEWMAQRYEELSAALAHNETAAGTADWQKLLREHAQLEAPVAAYRQYRTLLAHIAQAEELLAAPDMADMAREELAGLRAQKQSQEDALRLLLLPKDPDDERSVVVEVRAGAGGEEAGLFAADLVRMYVRYAERRGLKAEPVSESVSDLGAVKESVFLLRGRGAFSRMKFESGVHCVKRVPVTEAGGRIHTSTATVAVLPEAQDVEVQINPSDLRIDVYRSSGHGGQCVNTTDSAVRITHLPTGLVVTCQNEKSQIKNRAQALRVLKSRLLERTRAQQDAAYSENRRGQVGTGERSERIRTYRFLDDFVVDHRLGRQFNRVENILNGELDEIIDALTLEDQAQKLKALSEQ